MPLSYQQSLSQITRQTSLGLKTDTQSIFLSAVSTNTSISFGNVTTAFNNQLNGFINNLNAKRSAVNIELQNELANNPSFKGLRSKGVSLAWEYEQADIAMGGRGTVEGGWTDSEIQQIKQNGKPKIYDPSYDACRTPEGHHINSVSGHEDMQANPDNIRFYKSRKDHIDKGHKGNVNNPSEGALIDKNAHLRNTNRLRVFRNELRGVAVSAGIGFCIGFALSTIAKLALKGISSVDLGELIIHSVGSGIESAFLSSLGYGVSRLTTLGLQKIGFDLTNGIGSIANFAAVGLAVLAVMSIYQYLKLRVDGMSKEEAIAPVAKQTIFSISMLCVSILAQGIYGGCGGIIVSTSIGVIYFGYNLIGMIVQSKKAEKLRVETIKAYKEIILS